MNYWLMKTEPTSYSIDDLMLKPNQTDHWDGVRNYQARNFMRDQMRIDDQVLLYHSGKQPAVVGIATIVTEAYPDHTALDPASRHYDPKSSLENPIWYMVDVRFRAKFKAPLPLSLLRLQKGLEHMVLLKKGMRLSIQPVTKSEFDIIMKFSQTQTNS